MPGGARWRPSDEPFSYQKLCYFVPGLVFIGAVVMQAIEDYIPPTPTS